MVSRARAPSDAACPLAASAAATGTSSASASLPPACRERDQHGDDREFPHEYRVTPCGAEERIL